MMSQTNLECIPISALLEPKGSGKWKQIEAIVKSFFPTCNYLNVGWSYVTFCFGGKNVSLILSCVTPTTVSVSLIIPTGAGPYKTVSFARTEDSFITVLAVSLCAKLTEGNGCGYSFVERSVIRREDNCYRIWLDGKRAPLQAATTTVLLSDSDKAHLQPDSPKASQRINILSDIRAESYYSDPPNLFEESSFFNNPNAIAWED